jgi:hypothetical protein
LKHFCKRYKRNKEKQKKGKEEKKIKIEKRATGASLAQYQKPAAAH